MAVPSERGIPIQDPNRVGEQIHTVLTYIASLKNLNRSACRAKQVGASTLSCGGSKTLS